jgi:hypothetical protein
MRKGVVKAAMWTAVTVTEATKFEVKMFEIHRVL